MPLRATMVWPLMLRLFVMYGGREVHLSWGSVGLITGIKCNDKTGLRESYIIKGVKL